MAKSTMKDADYRRLAEFRGAMRKFMQFSADAARDAGLTPQQHQALLAIRGLNAGAEATVGSIAECLSSRHHSAVGLVDRLGELGLVRRQSDAADRRRVQVTLTPKADRLLESLSAAHIAELKRLKPALRALLELLE